MRDIFQTPGTNLRRVQYTCLFCTASAHDVLNSLVISELYVIICTFLTIYGTKYMNFFFLVTSLVE